MHAGEAHATAHRLSYRHMSVRDPICCLLQIDVKSSSLLIQHVRRTLLHNER